MKFDAQILQTGDVQIYGGHSPFNLLTSFFTFSYANHVEIAISPLQSIASRNGLGVDFYPRRARGLRYVLRPNIPVDLANALNWFQENARGRPYGYLDLLQFLGINIETDGMICSELSDLFFQNGGARMFNPLYPAGIVTPRDHLVVPGFDLLWSFRPHNSVRLPSTAP